MALIRNIGQLVAVPPGPVAGAMFSAPPVIENAAVLIEGDRIAWFGPEQDVPVEARRQKNSPTPQPSSLQGEGVVDAGGGIVVPGLIDCHTHVVFSGSREGEFVQKLRGASYLEILESGGGIRSTMRAVRAASEGELVAQSLPRVRRMLAGGVTTIEAKSGYGLDPANELKMLRAIRRVGELTCVEMIGTYLGAHATSPEFAGQNDEYLAAMIAPELLSAIRDEKLADFADVFCEKGAFTLEQSRRYLVHCAAAGLIPKVHAEQLSASGATRLAVELGAASADHLEFVTDEDIAALKRGSTIPVLLPGCSFFLNSPPAPARKLIAAGLPVALATDCNPGSCMIESLPLVMSIAATLLRMTPMETLVAVTANAAAALRRADRLGAIAVGHQADLLIVDAASVDQWVYRVAVPAVRTVIKAGRVVSFSH